MPIWDDVYLERLWNESDDHILDKTELVLYRFSLAVTSGVSVYTLPSYVRKLVRVTWKAWKLEALTPMEETFMFPESSVVDASNKYEAPSSVPRFYGVAGNNYYSFRLIPTPNENLAEVTTGLDGPNIKDGLIITCWRDVDTDKSSIYRIPSWLERRTKKPYVLSRAFAKEGKGQNTEVSKYFDTKFDFQLNLIKQIKAGSFISKRPQLTDGEIPAYRRRPARPVLPPNFEGYNL